MVQQDHCYSGFELNLNLSFLSIFVRDRINYESRWFITLPDLKLIDKFSAQGTDVT